MKIAWRHFRPGVGDGDERTRQIGISQARGFQHGSCGRSRDTLLYGVAVHDCLELLIYHLKQKAPQPEVRCGAHASRLCLDGWPAPAESYDRNSDHFVHKFSSRARRMIPFPGRHLDGEEHWENPAS